MTLLSKGSAACWSRCLHVPSCPASRPSGALLSVQVLLELHRTFALHFTTIEDASLGMWLAGMNVKRYNWPGVVWAGGWTLLHTCAKVRSLLT
jgi:hypothetical protein